MSTTRLDARLAQHRIIVSKMARIRPYISQLSRGLAKRFDMNIQIPTVNNLDSHLDRMRHSAEIMLWLGVMQECTFYGSYEPTDPIYQNWVTESEKTSPSTYVPTVDDLVYLEQLHRDLYDITNTFNEFTVEEPGNKSMKVLNNRMKNDVRRFDNKVADLYRSLSRHYKFEKLLK